MNLNCPNNQCEHPEFSRHMKQGGHRGSDTNPSNMPVTGHLGTNGTGKTLKPTHDLSKNSGIVGPRKPGTSDTAPKLLAPMAGIHPMVLAAGGAAAFYFLFLRK